MLDLTMKKPSTEMVRPLARSEIPSIVKVMGSGLRPNGAAAHHRLGVHVAADTGRVFNDEVWPSRSDSHCPIRRATRWQRSQRQSRGPIALAETDRFAPA